MTYYDDARELLVSLAFATCFAALSAFWWLVAVR
jgi:hypothetical protein